MYFIGVVLELWNFYRHYALKNGHVTGLLDAAEC